MTETISLAQLQTLMLNRGIKPSFQRLKILEFIIKHKTHPSVDKIFRRLSKKIPTLSRTTIYNTLTLFIEKGLVNALATADNEIRYDLSHEAHAHFQCRICGQIYDIEIEKLHKACSPNGNIPKEWTCPLCQVSQKKKVLLGHKMESVQTIIQGICKECLGK